MTPQAALSLQNRLTQEDIAEATRPLTTAQDVISASNDLVTRLSTLSAQSESSIADTSLRLGPSLGGAVGFNAARSTRPAQDIQVSALAAQGQGQILELVAQEQLDAAAARYENSVAQATERARAQQAAQAAAYAQSQASFTSSGGVGGDSGTTTSSADPSAPISGVNVQANQISGGLGSPKIPIPQASTTESVGFLGEVRPLKTELLQIQRDVGRPLTAEEAGIATDTLIDRSVLTNPQAPQAYVPNSIYSNDRFRNGF